MVTAIKSNPFADLARNLENTHTYKQKNCNLKQNVFRNIERHHRGLARNEAKEQNLRKVEICLLSTVQWEPYPFSSEINGSIFLFHSSFEEQLE